MPTTRDEATTAGVKIVEILVDAGVTEADFSRWTKDPELVGYLANTLRGHPGGLLIVRREMDGMHGSFWVHKHP
ncbi:MAG: hypothetical protein A2589_01920 [Candidatus Vogelbacteria bacterium RIFOXYD1_FULL_46_19]|uniref:Uncharacterized protein n=1 Tax=Candidatus Vogelbacteria bacterium RIFOXYD1_FULL_46_19 TaxID=1802439 RepID=A0A1G2QGH6_9BACT|nr:MAG: hypothetical protein A2589_01920 [Candidatus Vogelbacteria bacterium RIFOXYD1_FULL_46_19]